MQSIKSFKQIIIKGENADTKIYKYFNYMLDFNLKALIVITLYTYIQTWNLNEAKRKLNICMHSTFI